MASSVHLPLVDKGWIQINSTMVPCIKNGSSPLLPLSVLRHAADLPQGGHVECQRATQHQSALLNSCCKEAGIDFRFSKHTKLVTLDDLLSFYAKQDLYVDVGITENVFHHTDEQQLERNSLTPLWGYPPESRMLFYTQNGRDFVNPLHICLQQLPKPSVSQVAADVADKREEYLSGSDGASPILIQPRLFRGKAISCLIENGREFALLEVLSRVLFPQKESLNKVLSVVCKLEIPTRQLTLREELAFIEYYKLPTMGLHCKKAIDITFVAQYYHEFQRVYSLAGNIKSEHSRWQAKPFRPWTSGDTPTKESR